MQVHGALSATAGTEDIQGFAVSITYHAGVDDNPAHVVHFHPDHVSFHPAVRDVDGLRLLSALNKNPDAGIVRDHAVEDREGIDVVHLDGLVPALEPGITNERRPH